jgi:hypothetical protein
MHLDCETCLHLWAEYGTISNELRGTAEQPPPLDREPITARMNAILKTIRAHEAEVHNRKY